MCFGIDEYFSYIDDRKNAGEYIDSGHDKWFVIGEINPTQFNAIYWEVKKGHGRI